MASVTQPSIVGTAQAVVSAETVLPLEAGDALTRSEFERRYSAMPRLKKAELIEGIVYMASPVSHEHGRPTADLNCLLATYSARTPGTDRSDNATVRLDSDNEPQPDALLFILPEHGGQVRHTKPYIEGAPDLVAEAAASSASYDLHAKLQVYRRNGVREYIVWRVLDAAIDWFVLDDGRYRAIPLETDGILRSRVFPGLWLNTTALLRNDLDAALRTLDLGLASPEHAAFVAALAAARI